MAKFRSYLMARLFWLLGGVFIALSFIAFLIVSPTAQFYFTDYWEHLASIRDFRIHGLHPTNPIYALSVPAREFTPWHLALGLLSRVSGLSPEFVLGLGGVIISAVFLYGVWDFGRAYYEDTAAPGIFLAVLLCCWGYPPLIWTSFYSFRSQLHGNYYPAALGFALSLILWAQVIRVLRGAPLTLARVAGIVLSVTFMVVLHQLSVFFAIAGVGLFVVLEPGRIKDKLSLAILCVAGILLAGAWPYFQPLALLKFGAARGQEEFNNFTFFFSKRFILRQLGPSVLAIPIIPLYLRQRRYFAAIGGVVVFSAMFVVGAKLGISITHRFLPYIALFLHMLVCAALIDLLRGRLFSSAPRLRPVIRYAVAAAAALLICIHSTLAAAQLIWPWSLAGPAPRPEPVDNIMHRVGRICHDGVNVMAYGEDALVFPAFGCRVFAYPRPALFVKDAQERDQTMRDFFCPETPFADRMEIIKRFGITHVAWRWEETVPSWAAPGLRKLGKVVYDSDGWTVISVR
jgi:hypothetical protein